MSFCISNTGKNVLMYCTGGVRCERASALLKSKYGDNVGEVYQLQVRISSLFLFLFLFFSVVAHVLGVKCLGKRVFWKCFRVFIVPTL